jgi:hypothetical protein
MQLLVATQYSNYATQNFIWLSSVTVVNRYEEIPACINIFLIYLETIQ